MPNLKEYETLEILTKKTSIQQQKLLRIFAKLDTNQQLKIMNNKNSLFHKIRSKNKEIEENSIFTLAAFIIAIDEFITQLNCTEKNLIKFNNKRNKSNLKKQKLLQVWSIIKELKENKNMSFRNISNYLKEYHKINISYSLIYQKWNEIEEKR
jgi:hypothetical protein